MKFKNLKRSKLFWVFAIFVGFFMVTQIANRIQLHALKSSAFADASVGGINPNGECISFYQDVATCSHGWGYYDGGGGFGGGGGGGYGGGVSEYDQITGKQEHEQLCAWFPSLAICGGGNNNSSAGAHDATGSTHTSTNGHADAQSGTPNSNNSTHSSTNTNTRTTPTNNYNNSPYQAPQYTNPQYRYQDSINRCGASNVQWNGGANTWQCPGSSPANAQPANQTGGTGVVDTIVNTAKKYWPF